jgi:hypothetical protein
MAFVFQNILSDDDINYLNQLPEVAEAKIRLDTSVSEKIYFNIPITESIRKTLSEKFSIDLQGISRIPMRWIKGDTLPHIDKGISDFENTYLIYINDFIDKINLIINPCFVSKFKAPIKFDINK